MRHPSPSPIALLVPLLASLASAACGGLPFERAQNHDGPDDTTAEAGDDAGFVTVTIGAPDASPTEEDAAQDATLDAPSDSPLDAPLPDAAHDAEPSHDATSPADAAEPTDSAPPPDTGPSCTSSEKLCGSRCVALTDPTYGCAAATCDACDLPHATTVCNPSGACAIGACTADYADCNASPGCETSTTVASSCGSCTTVCPAATPFCVSGASGYACGDNCPSASPTLCGTTCVDEETDPNNCGSCGRVCPAITNGTDSCVSKVCTPACASGFQLCSIGGTTTCVAPDTTNGAFVSPSSVTTGCGSIGAPCGTIASGMLAAKNDGKKIVYLAAGTYDEQVTLPPGMTLQGGWTYEGTGIWNEAVCNGVADPSALAVIQTTSAGSAVLASSITATLDTVTVKNATTAAAGQSLYGIFASGTTSLTMNAVEVSVAAGGNGAAATGLGSVPTGPGPSCTPGSGAPATNKGPNGGYVASGYSSAGFVPGAGTTGWPGGTGANGTSGGSPKSAAADACTAEQACSPNGATVTGNPGTNGCGGPGGAPGLGGGGGGASIALFVTQATVKVVGGKLASGNAGSGGAGAAGAAAPSTWTYEKGQAGAATNVPTCRTEIISMAPACFNTTTAEDLGGVAGGAGGAGSAGGNGGTGAAGDSYSYYLLAGTGGSVTVSGSPAMTSGTVGAGGHAGAHN